MINIKTDYSFTVYKYRCISRWQNEIASFSLISYCESECSKQKTKYILELLGPCKCPCSSKINVHYSFFFFSYIFLRVFLTTLLLLILLFRIYPLLPTLLPFSFLFFFFRLLFVFVSLSAPLPPPHPPISFQILKASNFSFSLISPSAVRFSFSQCRRKKSNQPHNISRWIIESLREKKC